MAGALFRRALRGIQGEEGPPGYASGGFIELVPRHPVGAFRQTLSVVPGVTSVMDRGTVEITGNLYIQWNYHVYSEFHPGCPIEFAFTRTGGTCTACFKPSSPRLVPEAWRILRAACDGKELFPALVAEIAGRCVARYQDHPQKQPSKK